MEQTEDQLSEWMFKALTAEPDMTMVDKDGCLVVRLEPAEFARLVETTIEFTGAPK